MRCRWVYGSGTQNGIADFRREGLSAVFADSTAAKEPWTILLVMAIFRRPQGLHGWRRVRAAVEKPHGCRARSDP